MGLGLVYYSRGHVNAVCFYPVSFMLLHMHHLKYRETVDPKPLFLHFAWDLDKYILAEYIKMLFAFILFHVAAYASS